MSERMTVTTYLSGEETNRRRELDHGVLREPSAPTFVHQMVVGRVFERLDRHVRRLGCGVVVTSPIDVILDREQHLVVQPDLVFVRSARLGICADRIWGPPDLIVEVLSLGHQRRDRTVKVEWYGRYGVPECWLVDMVAETVDVVDLTGSRHIVRTFERGQRVRSAVLPRLRVTPGDFFRS